MLGLEIVMTNQTKFQKTGKQPLTSEKQKNKKSWKYLYEKKKKHTCLLV